MIMLKNECGIFYAENIFIGSGPGENVTQILAFNYYCDKKHSDWSFHVTLQFLTNHSELFKSS